MYPSQRLMYKMYDSKQNTIKKTETKKKIIITIKNKKTKRTKIITTIKNISTLVTLCNQSKRRIVPYFTSGH